MPPETSSVAVPMRFVQCFAGLVVAPHEEIVLPERAARSTENAIGGSQHGVSAGIDGHGIARVLELRAELARPEHLPAPS